jgi:aryl-alcohol dehydrogenase-like predicted oxidoreductase
VNCLLGLGTYRCRDVRKAAGIAAAAGCPLIDTAPVYGNGAAQQQLAPVLAAYPKLRVSTKIGHMTVQQARRAVRAGAIRQEEVHNGHSIHPDYVDFQLRENIAELGRPAIDLVYLHNPERFGDTDPELLHTALRSAFERLEKACADGVIDGYGVATWSGFKDGAFTVPRLAKLAQEAAGSPETGLTAVQLPVSLVEITAMEEAVHQRGPIVEAVDRGLEVWAAAPLHGGELVSLVNRSLADFIAPGVPPVVAALMAVAATPATGSWSQPVLGNTGTPRWRQSRVPRWMTTR